MTLYILAYIQGLSINVRGRLKHCKHHIEVLRTDDMVLLFVPGLLKISFCTAVPPDHRLLGLCPKSRIRVAVEWNFRALGS